MKKTIIGFLSIFVLNILLVNSKPATTPDLVTIDFEMVEKGIQWLEFINTGADDKAIKKYFMSHVAPTNGCQAIIHHWARFKEWNNETFYQFIMTAMERIPTDKKFKKEDGWAGAGTCG